MSFSASICLCSDSASPSVQAALSLLLHLWQNPAIWKSAILSLQLSFLTLKWQDCQTSGKERTREKLKGVRAEWEMQEDPRQKDSRD